MGKQTAARGSAILLVVLLVGSVFGYLFNMGLAWLLPAEDYGIYGTAISLVGILAAFVIHGFPWAVTRFLAQEDDPQKKAGIFRTILFANLLVALAVVAVYLLIYELFLPDSGLPFSIIAMILMLVLLDAARVVYLRALHGQMQFDRFGFVSIAEAVTRLGFGITMVLLYRSATGALSGMVFSGIVAIAISSYLLRDIKFWRAKSIASLSILAFAWAALVGNLSMTVLSQIDILVVKFLGSGSISDQAVGYYQAIRLLSQIPLFLAGSIVNGVFPFISQATNEESRMYSLFSLRYVFLASMPIALLLAVLPGSIIAFFFPEAYSASADVLRVLALGGVLIALIQVSLQLFQALGKPGFPAKAVTASAALQIVLLVVLVPKFGMMGAAVAMVAACLLGTIWLLTVIIRRYGFKVKASSIIKYISILLICGLVEYYVPHSNRLLLVVDVIVSGFLYMGLIITFGFIGQVDFNVLKQVFPSNKLTDKCVATLSKFTARFGH